MKEPRYNKWLLFSFKEEQWTNVHYEFESAESGRWHIGGDAYMYDFYEEWFCIFGFKIWRTKIITKNRGLYNIELDDPTQSIYENN